MNLALLVLMLFSVSLGKQEQKTNFEIENDKIKVVLNVNSHIVDILVKDPYFSMKKIIGLKSIACDVIDSREQVYRVFVPNQDTIYFLYPSYVKTIFLSQQNSFAINTKVTGYDKKLALEHKINIHKPAWSVDPSPYFEQKEDMVTLTHPRGQLYWQHTESTITEHNCYINSQGGNVITTYIKPPYSNMEDSNDIVSGLNVLLRYFYRTLGSSSFIATFFVLLFLKTFLFPIFVESQICDFYMEKITTQLKKLSEKYADESHIYYEVVKLIAFYGINPIRIVFGLLIKLIEIPILISFLQIIRESNIYLGEYLMSGEAIVHSGPSKYPHIILIMMFTLYLWYILQDKIDSDSLPIVLITLAIASQFIWNSSYIQLFYLVSIFFLNTIFTQIEGFLLHNFRHQSRGRKDISKY